MMTWRTFVGIGVVMAAVTGTAFPADDEDELPVYHPGLVAELTQEGRTTVRRVDEDVQFVWREGVPDERLAGGPFAGRWRGRLFVMSPGSYRLHLYVAGQVELRLNGQAILTASTDAPAWHESAPITLGYGHHSLEIDYRRTNDHAALKLHWSGPQFSLEPIPERHLFHEPSQSPPTQFEEGRLLVRALRCAACHATPHDVAPLPAPALTHLAGNLNPTWLIEHLTFKSGADKAVGDPQRRRMPHPPLSRDEAVDVAAYLFAQSQQSTPVKLPEPEDPPPSPPQPTESQKKPKPRTKPSVTLGQQLTRSLGCLACHRVGDLGSDGLFAGNELTQVAAKRSPEFLVRWFHDAALVNADHRMPQFKLNGLEAADLASYLATLGTRPVADLKLPDDAQRERGRALVAEHHCAACHRLSDPAPKPSRVAASLVSTKDPVGCLGEPDAAKKRPGYRLSETARAAVVEYLKASPGTNVVALSAADEGRFVMAERNCLGCHSRGLRMGLAERVPAITAADPELAPVQAALLPPSLNGVGDKLTDAALIAAVKTDRPPLRPWLRVRMPKFPLSEAETSALQSYLVDHDRIPDRPAPAMAETDETAQRLAARRLVTADGFGCTSCHKIGKAEPSGTISISAMGTDLSLVGDRLRKPWFDRWVRNPARIIPRMEMPAVQLAVKGVLHDDVNEQLAAVWKVLNEPGFTPPKPNPVRIVRSRNVPGLKEPPHVLTDVFILDDTTYVSPIVIGLPNRHNILFDLEHNRLAAWWTGDTALERTKGKSWYWEPGGATVFVSRDVPEDATEWMMLNDSNPAGEAIVATQNQAVVDEIARTPSGVTVTYRLRENGSRFRQTFESLPRDDANPTQSGFRRTIEMSAEVGVAAFFSFVGAENDVKSIDPRTQELLGVSGRPRVVDRTPVEDQKLCSVGPFHAARSKGGKSPLRIVVDYQVDLPLDTFPNETPSLPSPPPMKLDVAPGYEAVRLPLPAGEMPTGFSWTADGTLLFASLKGRVLAARDTNGDGLEDSLAPLSDDLATPYGLAVARQNDREVIDVITKPALIRLHDDDRDGFFERQEIAADGWGHTDDYHDWAVGLPKILDDQGRDAGYYVALPCQQDDRDPVKARLRGEGLKLIPREPTKDDPRPFRIEPFCAGLRFPMGLAVDRRGNLFASDNQGHYNPFNELNHLQTGKRYGYLNKLERKPGFHPPTETPAVEIPHPWTRSVNGICFLDTPAALRAKTGRDHFGPFEGHLIGCEYNERVLVRMSLEEVDGVFQGAAYPFTLPVMENAPTLEGPNVAAVAPDGDLYVGSLRDSGWGGGQNTGSIVRITPQGSLPLGIAEVRAMSDGFVMRFTGEVNSEKLADAKNFVIERYRRESTPQYGGDDKDRGTLRVTAAVPSADGREVRLRCEPLTAGFVYEFHLRNLAAEGATFFPAEAHYTLKRVPR